MPWPLALAAVASAQDCPEFESCPVAAELREVSWNYGERYQLAVARVMVGERSHPLFNRAVNQADVHWRLLAATGEGLYADEATANEWRDVALAGSFLAFDQVVSETFGRAPELDALRVAVDTVISPSVDVTLRKDGRVTVRHPTGWELGQRVERQEQELGLEPRNGRHRRSRLHLGVGWKLRDLDAPNSAPVLAWTAHLAAQNFGLSLFRADVDVLTLRWDVIARQRLLGDFAAVAGVHAQEQGFDPGRWSVGAAWSPVPRGTVRLERSQAFDKDGWRVDLVARLEVGGTLAGDYRAPVAGLPSVVDTSPNRLAPPWSWAGSR